MPLELASRLPGTTHPKPFHCLHPTNLSSQKTPSIVCLNIIPVSTITMASQDNNLLPPQRALLPKSKMDTEAIEQMSHLDARTLEPLIPDLLVWIQDANWPIAWPIVELLRKHPSIVVGPVRKILRDEAGEKDDGEWKHNCLTSLVADMDKEHKLTLKEELVRMASLSTKGEKEWETADTAKEILEELGVTFEAGDNASRDAEPETK